MSSKNGLQWRAAKIKIWGTDACEKCKCLLRGLNLIGVKYEYYDADTEESNIFLDGFGVDVLPFVQLEDDRGTWQSEGVTLVDVINRLKQYDSQQATGNSSESP